MFAVVRVRGVVKARKEIGDTLSLLRLRRKMHCVLLKDDKSLKGMLNAVKDYVTWGEVSDEVLKNLILKRGRKEGDKKLTDKEVPEVFEKIKQNYDFNGIKKIFRLTPPSKGFRKSIKQHYPNGELGYRGEEINKLLKRMI